MVAVGALVLGRAAGVVPADDRLRGQRHRGVVEGQTRVPRPLQTAVPAEAVPAQRPLQAAPAEGRSHQVRGRSRLHQLRAGHVRSEAAPGYTS